MYANVCCNVIYITVENKIIKKWRKKKSINSKRWNVKIRISKNKFMLGKKKIMIRKWAKGSQVQKKQRENWMVK
jgi:hypothetical protein